LGADCNAVAFQLKIFSSLSNYFQPMRLFVPIILLFCGFGTLLFSQKNAPRDSLKFNNRLYKQELDLDVQGVFAGFVGGALIWKIRDDRSKLIPVSYAKFWRISGGTQSSTFTGIKDTLQVGGVILTNISPSYSNSYTWATFGKERVNFYNRFNVYYGWEAGIDGGHSRQNVADYYYYSDNNLQYLRLTRKEVLGGVSGGGFLGIKYRINDRISVSLEAAGTVNYRIARRRLKGTLNYIEAESNRKIYHTFGHRLDYLRFLTVNYHFKKY
jgi:hypothetical protein